jgi:outer membrane protein assembly factor BamB
VRAGDALYLTSDLRQGGVTALAADGGDVLWRATQQLDHGTAVTADRVVVAAGDRVFARSRTDGTLDWSTSVGATVAAHPVADRDTVYVALDGEDGSSVHALALDGGDGRWTVGFDRPVEAPVVVDDGLLVPTRDREDGAERLHVLTER